MINTVLSVGESVRKKEMTWAQAADIVNQKHSTNLTDTAVRNRFERYEKKGIAAAPTTEYEATSALTGVIEAQRICELPADIRGNNDKLMEYLGYDPTKYRFVNLTISTWQQHTREQVTKNLYAVKFKLEPIYTDGNPHDALEVAREILCGGISPLKKVIKQQSGLNKDVLLEMPPVELHLGKLAWSGDTGEDYDSKIACTIFQSILAKTLEEQAVTKAHKLLIVIGGDFFNSDTVDNTTTRGTQQHNDSRFKKMFHTGLKLYKDALEQMLQAFGDIDVILCQGNHDYMSSFYLYVALQQYFSNQTRINFSSDYKSTQAYRFGNAAIFFNHGDVNLKRIIKSIPAEFPRVWGDSLYRELHLGHLHKEVVVDDEGGMITRRIGSGTGSDDWHYGERYIGATKKHQLFTWHALDGLVNCRYIPFKSEMYAS